MSSESSYSATLSKLYAAEREAQRLHDELANEALDGGGRDELVKLMRRHLDDANASSDAEEATIRLVCLARLFGELDGADVADALVDVLNSEHPEARKEAGEHLQGLAFDRFKEVAGAVERALERLEAGAPALVELPYVLVEVLDGGVVPLLSRFLTHADADAVAAAIEALVEVGDPVAIKPLLALQGDTRTSVLGEEDDEAEVTIGELATDAIELLKQAED